MRRHPASALALALAMAAAGCEFLPQSPLAELEAPPSLPQPQTTWLDLGRRLLADDRPEQAEDAFIRSLRVEGVTAAALTGAGVAAERQGMLAEARRHFEAARRRAPDSVTAHVNLGIALYRLGELHAARNAFQEALLLSGGTSDVARRNVEICQAAIRRAETAAAGGIDGGTDRGAGAGGPGPARDPHRTEPVAPPRYRLSGLLQIQEDG